MPIKKTAFKALRQSRKRHERNKSAATELRTLAKQANLLISEKKKEDANVVLKKLESRLSRAAKSHLIKKETASRRISRMRIQWAKIGDEGKKK